MSRKLIALIGFCFILVTVACAEPPKIIKGYGLTEWGQSVEQVKKLLPDLKETTSAREYVVPGQEPFKEIQYGFIDDKLFKVEAVLSAKVREEVGNRPVEEIIKRKYYTNKEVTNLLSEEKIFVYNSAQKIDGIYYDSVVYEKRSIPISVMEKAKKEQELKRQEAIKELRLEELL